jgi:TolB-like protein/Tfp pilus assembly protein PilF
VVTREEIHSHLWGDTTFVDFERGINFSINQIRAALCDDAEKPRYIETLPRAGYRFIGTLEPQNGNSTEAVLPGSAPSIQVVDPTSHNQKSTASRSRLWKRGPLYGLMLGLAAVAAWWGIDHSRRSLGAASPGIRSLAVLPLENLSGDPSQDYFADGMTDQLITDLGQVGALRVTSRTSIMQYKKAKKSLPQIARELNVDGIVEGTVLRSGENVRITAQLIHASTDEHVWAASYQGSLQDVLGLQSTVADAIATKVLSQIGATGANRSRPTRTIHPDAFEAYLRGRSQSPTIDGEQNRIQYFNSAIQKQPDYAEAYAALAASYASLGHMLALPPKESFSKAKAAALKAIELDDRLADAHAILGQVELLYDWDFIAAEREVRRAIELNPNSVGAHGRYAEVLAATHHYDEAIVEAGRMRQIDPLAQLGSASTTAFLYWARRYDDAIAEAQAVLANDPNSYAGHLWLGLSLEQKHQFPAALAELKKAVELSNDKMWVGFIAHDLALSGDQAGARKILRELEKHSKEMYVSPWWPAMVYPDLGDKEKAFLWLQKAYEGREHDLVFSNCWPMFDPLRDDPRFKDLMQRIGLPQ